MKSFIVRALLPLLIVGCSTSSSDPDVDAWEKEVRILTPAQVGERQYEELGGLLEEREMIGGSVDGEGEAIDVARRKLRRRAAQLDADAIVIVECGRHVLPVDEAGMPALGPEVVCHGVAIRWMD